MTAMPAGPLSAAHRDAIRRVLQHPTFELTPLADVLDQAAHLPPGARVAVTASPTRPLENTLDLAAELQQRGFSVVPHLAARAIRDLAHLAALLERLDALEIRSVFVIGGDSKDSGDFYDAASVLRAMAGIGVGFDEVGIAAYPEGHHIFDDQTAAMALYDKQPYATSMTTQMCFDANAIASWLTEVRSDGITLPAEIGIPGVADRIDLMRISARIGVGRSMRFLSKHRGMLRSLAGPSRYSPDGLLADMADRLDDPLADISGVHIYTFNQVATTERWRRGYLEELAG